MIELLRRAATERPHAIAIVTPDRQTSYLELLDAARSAANWFRERDIRRVGVLDPDPARVLAVLAGASWVGAEACVYPLAATDEVADELAERFNHSCVVSGRTLLRTETTDDELFGSSPLSEVAPITDKRPVLVLTTGTSGYPRGVRHDWNRLLHSAQAIKPAPGQRWLLAYGLNQFGGLQILLHVLASQATLVAARSFQPRDALVALRGEGITHASGTPTFWRFIIGEIRGSSDAVPLLQQVTLGGEVVPTALLNQLRETFPGANISQIYGATEFGQNVTVRDGLPGLPLSFLESGRDVEFKVVDGELWVRSRASMLGYHGEEEVARSEWRATGDLVEIVGERVEFRGRKTDVINVGGVKIHPIPVEDRISTVAGVSLVRVYGRPNALTGFVVAAEMVLDGGHDPDSVETAVREACSDLPPAARPRSFRFVPTISTTGNKMNRGDAR